MVEQTLEGENTKQKVKTTELDTTLNKSEKN
jgi:hypothetical protein